MKYAQILMAAFAIALALSPIASDASPSRALGGGDGVLVQSEHRG